MSEYTLTTVDDLYKDLLVRLGVNGHSGAIAEIDELRRVALILNHEMLEALEASVACGLIPITSAREGGAAMFSEQVRVADMVRAAIAKAKGESESLATSEEKSE